MQRMIQRLMVLIVGILACNGKSWGQDSRYLNIPLQDHYNTQAIADGPGKVDFDGAWRSFPAAGFARTMMNPPADSLPWPSWALAEEHCVSALNQKIAIPRGKYQVIYLLACSLGGRTWCELTLRYAGSRLEKVGVVVPDWRLPPEADDIVALEFGFFNSGHSIVRENCRAFVIPIAVDDQQPLEGLDLPFAPNVSIFGMVLDTGKPLWKSKSATRLAPDERGNEAGVKPFQSVRVNEPPVGYLVDPLAGGLDQLPDTDATASLAHIFSWRMSSVADRQNDWRVAAKWLRFCYGADLPTVPILENSPFWAARGWLGAYIRHNEQGMVFADGSTSTWPALNSEIYRQETEAYVCKCVEWGNRNDPSRLIIAWANGSDWHYPGRHDYSNSAQQGFRQWLRERYTAGLADINDYWGTEFKTWDEVRPPQIVRTGNETQGLATWALQNEQVQATWSLAQDWRIPIQAQQRYSAAVTVALKGMPYTMASFQIQWQDSQGYPVGPEETAICAQVTDGVYRYTWQGTAPEKASQVWLACQTLGAGEACFDDVLFMEVGGQTNLLAHPSFEIGTGEQPEGWQFDTSSGNATGRWLNATESPLGNGRCISIVAKEGGSVYRNPGAAVRDWVVYSWEALAKTMDNQAAIIKAADPSRKVVTNFDFAWAMALCWDEVIGTSALDVGLSLAKNTDIIGLQLSAARGDIHPSVAAIDLARKYGKPIWATGLADYVSGTSLGIRQLRELDQACIQHGSAGLFHHLWHGVEPYAYSSLSVDDNRSLIEHSIDSIQAVAGMSTEADCALICPLLPYCADDPGGVRNDPFDFFGWYRLLAHQQVPVDVITCHELSEIDTRILNGYRLMVLPDAQWLPVSNVRQIDAWVSRGGKLIISGRPVQMDQHGRPGPTLQCLQSAPPEDGNPHAFTYGQGKVVRLPEMAGRRILDRMYRQPGLAGVPPMFVEEQGANHSNLIADGQAIWNYCAHEVEYQPLIRLAGAGADVEAALWVGADKQLVFLLNRGETVASGIELLRPAPPDGVSVQVKRDAQDWQEVQFSGGRALLPDFNTTCLVWMASTPAISPPQTAPARSQRRTYRQPITSRLGEFIDRFRSPED